VTSSADACRVPSSQRALEVGIRYFTAEILAENRPMLAILPGLGRVETEAHGLVVTARIELTERPRRAWARARRRSRPGLRGRPQNRRA
jgi:hypothetical protein